MRGGEFFRVLQEYKLKEFGLSDTQYERTYLIAPRYVSATQFTDICFVETHENMKEDFDLFPMKDFHVIPEGTAFYVAGDRAKRVWFIISPEENERMERFLAGTTDPMWDFVHELRNNPFFMIDERLRKKGKLYNQRSGHERRDSL